MTAGIPPDFHAAADALAGDGWCLLDGLMHPAQTQALANECAAMHDARLLQPARIGAARVASPLRGDSSRWFVTGAMSAPQQMFADRMDTLRAALNRELMLSLVDCESHYAVDRPAISFRTRAPWPSTTRSRAMAARRWAWSACCACTSCSTGSTWPTRRARRRCWTARHCAASWASTWGASACPTAPRRSEEHT